MAGAVRQPQNPFEQALGGLFGGLAQNHGDRRHEPTQQIGAQPSDPLSAMLQAFGTVASAMNDGPHVQNSGSPHNARGYPGPSQVPPAQSNQQFREDGRVSSQYGAPHQGAQQQQFEHPLFAFGGLVAGVSHAVAATGAGAHQQNSRSRGSAPSSGQLAQSFDAPRFVAGVSQAVSAAAALQAPLQEMFGGLQPHLSSSVQRGVDPTTLEASTMRATYSGPGASSGGSRVGGPNSSTDPNDRCAVCFEDFCSGEELRVLPCFHRYHQACIDPWLCQNRACPVCKHSIV